jgi:hypothetical protein
VVRDYYKALIKALEEEKMTKMNALATGSADLAGYKYGCGEIHGLDLAIAHAKAMLTNYEEADDESFD